MQLTDRTGSRRRSFKRVAICSTLGLAVLAGCVETTSSISRNRLYGRYDVTEVQWGNGGGRDFTVVVRNNPTTLPGEEFEQKVVDAIQGQITYMVTNFTTTPGESARRQYRVEFFFDPPDTTTNGFALCDPTRDLPETVPRPGVTYVLAAYCLRDRPLSEAFGSSADAAPGTEGFDRLMSQVVRSILPQYHRGRRSSRCPPQATCG